MKGLILKDLNLLMVYGKQYAIAVLFLFILAAVYKNNNMLLFYLLFIGGMLVMSTLSIDGNVHFFRLALTMPVNARMLVGSKYILLGAFQMLGGIAGVIIIRGRQFLGGQAAGPEDYLIISIYWFISVFVWAVSYPFVFRMGAEKARHVYLGVILLFSILYLAGVRLARSGAVRNYLERRKDLFAGIEEKIQNISWQFLAVMLIGVSCIFLVISFCCSLRLVKHKEW